MSTTVGRLTQYQINMALSASPTVYTTLTSRLVACSITRGRTDELGTMQPGTMTLTLDNGDGAFSPDNPSSPYAGYLVPGRRVQILARFDTATAWNPLYTGYIDSIRPEDNGPLDSNVVFQCVDWLGLMSIKSVNGTTTSGGAGAHDLINWFASLMSIVDGSATATIVNPTDGTSQHLLDFPLVDANALQALNDFAATVRGVVFAGADGTVRATANGGTATSTLFNTLFTFDQQGLNLAASVVPYTAMDYDLTTQYLYNDITVTATGTAEGPQNAQDAASIAAYGKRSLVLQFAFMDIGQAAPMANTLLLAYRDPKPRVHALTIDLDGTTAITQSGHTAADLLFQLELTAPVTVVKQQPGSLGINRAMVVEGIKHDLAPDFGGAGVMHTLTLQLTEATNINPTVWVLGTSGLGVDNALSYGPPSFDPTTIGGCTLYLWGGAGIQATGTNVTAWFDQSGNGRTGTAGTRPPHLGGIGVDFSAADPLSFASSPLGASWSLFIVFAPGVGGGALFITRDAAGTAEQRFLTFGLDHLGADEEDGTEVVSAADTVTIPASPPTLAIATSAAGQPLTVYTNSDAGVSASAALPLLSFTAATVTLGGDPGSLPFYGSIACVIAFNHVLTDPDRLFIINGLNARYRLF